MAADTPPSSKQKLHAYGAEIYADWDVYGGKHPRMYKADKVDVEIARLHEELRQARIDLAQMAAEALRTIGKVVAPSETADYEANRIDKGGAPLVPCQIHGESPCLRWYQGGHVFAHPSALDATRWAAEHPDPVIPQQPIALCKHGYGPTCAKCHRDAEKASEPQPDPIPQRYWENK